MQFLAVLVGLIVLSINGHNALAHPASNLVPREEAVTPRKMGKYTIMPATWTGPIFPGGSNVTFTDKSILDVTGQILKLNPDYDFTMSSDHEAHNVTGSTRRAGYVPTEHGIVPRAAITPPACSCPGVSPAPDTATINGMVKAWVRYNLGIPVGPGPATCTEFGCIRNNGIYLCNDNPYTISPALPYLLGNYVAVIAATCGTSGDTVIGQEFDTDGYNVIVGLCGYDWDPY